MNKIAVLSLTLLLFFISCKDNTVKEYSNTLSTSIKKSQDVALQSEITNLKRAVQAFSEEKGKLPNSIEELERYVNRPIDREKIKYDPETGEVYTK